MTHTSDADPLPEANHQSRSSDFSPAFSIGSLPIYGQLILAPMDGISDPPFRLITRRLGSALSLSEFINTLDFSVQKHFQQSRFAFQPQERPFGIQLLDNDPQRMADSAGEIYAKYKPDFFDINLGCATARIASRGAGVGLMRTPEKVAQIFQQVNQAVPVPLTTKMRLGWDEDSLNYREVAEIAVANGAQAITLHGRTGKMAYRGKARWEPISELKSCLPVPVIGNGDVTTPALARQMLTETGCDAVMIGRGAKTNPWIFSWRERSEVPPSEVYGLICYQYRAMQPYYPNGAVLPFRKFLKAYLEPYDLPNNRLQAILTAKQEDQLFKQLDHLFLELGVLNLNAAREVFDIYMQTW
jgi:nifR3 family TIM-barrel protein